MTDLVVACADVGSVFSGRFGWWASDGASGTRLSTLAKHLADALNNAIPVALGFECPLFVPIAVDEVQLTSGRPGEGSRSWSAGAGCGSLATGLTQVVWLLQNLRAQLRVAVVSSIEWESFQRANSGLFLWEAFVSGAAKSDDHIADAQAGARAFLSALPDVAAANAVVCRSEVYSLIGAALLRTGWCADIGILQQPCLVLRAGDHAS